MWKWSLYRIFIGAILVFAGVMNIIFSLITILSVPPQFRSFLVLLGTAVLFICLGILLIKYHIKVIEKEDAALKEEENNHCLSRMPTYDSFQDYMVSLYCSISILQDYLENKNIDKYHNKLFRYNHQAYQLVKNEYSKNDIEDYFDKIIKTNNLEMQNIKQFMAISEYQFIAKGDLDGSLLKSIDLRNQSLRMNFLINEENKSIVFKVQEEILTEHSLEKIKNLKDNEHIQKSGLYILDNQVYFVMFINNKFDNQYFIEIPIKSLQCYQIKKGGDV